MAEFKKIKLRLLLSFCIFYLLCINLFSQIPENIPDYSSLSTLLSFSEKNKYPTTMGGDNLIAPVNDKEYEVDSGDEFQVRIDVAGPDVKIRQVKVTSDGYVLFSEVPAIFVRGIKLDKAKDKIKAEIAKYYENAKIDIVLNRLHRINVSVIGALQPINLPELSSASRLFDVIQSIVISYQADTLRRNDLNRASIRRIDIIHQNQKSSYDLLRFLRLGQLENNPILRSEDVINIQYKDSLAGNVLIQGMVGSPGLYELLPHDNLSLLLSLAGNMLPGADSSRIELYRNSEKAKKHYFVSYSDAKEIKIQPGDAIFVRRGIAHREYKLVSVRGEVKYPGNYLIDEGETRLGDVIKRAGGFTAEADLNLAYVRRILEQNPGFGEVRRVVQTSPTKLSMVEESYLKSFYRQNWNVLPVDFEKLFNENDSTDNNYLLKDKDEIVVPAKLPVVYVIGAIKKPGPYPYKAGQSIQEYVDLAGGYEARAKSSKIRLISGKAGYWLEAKTNSVPNAGDQIFIPQRETREIWPVLKEVLTVVVQIGTVFVIIRSTK